MLEEYSKTIPGASQKDLVSNRAMVNEIYPEYVRTLNNVVDKVNSDPHFLDDLGPSLSRQLKQQMTFSPETGKWVPKPVPKAHYENALDAATKPPKKPSLRERLFGGGKKEGS